MERTQTPEKLSERELQVLELVGRRRTNPEIADELGMTFATAKWYVSQLIAKEGVTSREELAAVWRERNSGRARVMRWARAAVGPPVLKVALGGSAAALALIGGAAIVMELRASGGETSAEAASPTAAVTPAEAWSPNILLVSPADGSTVAWASMVPAGVTDPVGVCAEVTFDGLTDNFRAFRMTLDGEDVTPRLMLLMIGSQPTKGVLCLTQAGGIPPGHYTARVQVVEPAGAAGPPSQTVTWSFDVTP
ncbi:MAG: helix-turn-helix transcriptional regulator [Chloroflexi bacterium]|nr:helix-turn-helix transcriptional regulator [Chloroflexota bacterium]